MQTRPRAVAVRPLEGHRLLVSFDNDQERIFDVTPYIKGNWFGELDDPKTFAQVRVGGLSVEWPGGQDICPDRLWEDSEPIS